MAKVTTGDLFHIYFQLHYEIDDGKTAPIDGAQDAIVEGEAIDYIQKHANIDLSLFSQDKLDAIDEAFINWGVYDKKRTGAYNNGLAMISSCLMLMIQHADWEDPSTNNQIDITELELQ